METKKEKQHVKFVLYDSREELPYEDYKGECEINGCEPDGEDSQDYWDWVCQTREDYWDDLKMNMCWSKIDYPLIITGSLGLWDGRHDIKPMIIESEGYGRKFSTCDYTGYELPSIKKAIEKKAGKPAAPAKKPAHKANRSARLVKKVESKKAAAK